LFGVVFELNMKIFAPLLVVICFTAGIAGAYVGAYYFTQPHHPTDNTTPETPPITDINTPPENTPTQIKPTISPTPTPTPEKTHTMHVYEFCLQEQPTYEGTNKIIDELTQGGNYYGKERWSVSVPQGSSQSIERILIAFYEKATSEQYKRIEQASIESYGIKYATVEIPQSTVEKYEQGKWDLENGGIYAGVVLPPSGIPNYID
jgi:hypothetical protein